PKADTEMTGSIAASHIEQQLYELCSDHVRKSSPDCSNALAKLMQQHQQSESTLSSINFESLLADALSVVDLETTLKSQNSPERQRLLALIRQCQSMQLTVEPLLKERLTDETLEELDIIASKQAFQSRYVKLKTRLFYKQQKFNLLREENEGFAKLIVELGALASVLDLVLDACEVRSDEAEQLLDMVRLYRPNPADLCQLLGHKFTFYQGAATPTGLYRVCAAAVKSKLAELRLLLPHLWPSMSEMEPLLTQQLQEAKKYARKAAASAPLLDAAALDVNLDQLAVPGFRPSQPTQPMAPPLMQQSEQHQQQHTTGATPSTAIDLDAADSSSAAAADPDPESNLVAGSAVADLLQGPAGAQFAHNQLLGLAEALLEAGDFNSARVLLDKFPSGIAGCHPIEPAALHYRSRSLSPPTLPSAGCPLAFARTGLLLLSRSSVGSEPGEALKNPAVTAVICRTAYALHVCRSLPVIESRSHATLRAAPAAAHNRSDTFIVQIPRQRLPDPDPESNLVAGSAVYCKARPAPCSQSAARPALLEAGDFNSALPSHTVTRLNRRSALSVTPLRLRYRLPAARLPHSIHAHAQAVFNLLDECILPALSLSEANCPLGELVWSLVRHLPFDLRYRLYGQYVMKRLTKDNVKQQGRQLGKLSHSNPGPLFEVVIEQITRYDNLVTPVVDSFRYLNSLGLDVLAYCIIEALADSSEDSPRLLTLSTFVGAMCKKYTFDLAGCFQYALNQLKNKRCADLLLVREILHKMTGIEVSEEVTEEQLEAMLGGELLRVEGGYFSQVRNTKKSSSRLKELLMEHGLVLPFVFLLAQQRDCVVFNGEPTERHVKQCGRLYDNCQDVLIQFGIFLSLQLSTDEFVAQCPSIDQLINVYHVPADAAFYLLRSGFAHTINQLCDRKLRAGKREAAASAAAASAESADGGGDKGPAQDAQSVDPLEITSFVDASVEVTREVSEKVRGLYPKKVWDDLNIEFFVTFWTLQCCDLEVPKEAYKRQRQAIETQLKSVEDNAAMQTNKKKKEKERLQALTDRLTEEERLLATHVSRVRARIAKDKDLWFHTQRSTKTDTVTTFLQFCVFPRILFTAQDAVYSAKFIYILHASKTANFSTLICFDRIFNDITLPLACLTENEARRYGRFLKTMLDTIMKWHSSVDVYKRECEGYPGFSTVFRKGVDGAPSSKGPDQLSYENYRHVVHKWHYRITKAFIACLEHGNYALIRNALLVLIRILAYYPRIQQFGSAVERRVEKLRQAEREKRKDLEAMAISYLGMLKKRKTEWVPEEAFHKKEKVEKSDATNGGPHAAAAVTASIRRAGSTANPGKAPGASPSRAAEQQQQQQQQQPDAKRRRTEHQHQRSAAAPAASAAPTSSETTSGSKRSAAAAAASGSGEAAS
uniref:THO complex subunit 2 n=1 Tax=Macrostomum lignano TaxID=282301 RepID=A0A1I8G259_9PLAT